MKSRNARGGALTASAPSHNVASTQISGLSDTPEVVMATRREFLTVTASTLAGAALTSRNALGAPKAMTVVRESSFIKPFDDYFAKTLATEYEKQTGIKINYEATSVGGMLTRLTTIAETKSGPEIAMTALNWPHLFDQSLVDVTDIAGEIGKQLGGWHENVLEVLVVNKKWKALPWGNIGQLEVYRTDWFKEVGVNKFPETWEDLLAAGRLLKKKGHPFGFELGHGFGDNHGWLYPLFWSYGGREVDRDGKTVDIDSAATAKAVDFCPQMSRWLASATAYYAPFLHGYDNHPMWNVEPRYLPYKESLKTSRPHTWPGPQGHASSESVAKYVLVDMFAKACRGDSTKDVVATAAAQLKQIYKAKYSSTRPSRLRRRR